MSDAQVDVVINSVANTAGFTQARSELAALGGGASSLQTKESFNPSFGNNLTVQEAAYARTQLASKELATAERDLSSEGNAVARAFGSMGGAAGEASGRLGALAGVMGSTGPLGLAIGGTLIAFGVLYELGKSEIENSAKNEASQKSLTQAYGTLGLKLTDYVPSHAKANQVSADGVVQMKATGTALETYGQLIDDFIDKNSQYISSQYEAKEGFASLARAGFDTTMQQRLMNDALDLSVAKHESLGDAVTNLILASQGNSRALKELGISASDVTNVQKNLEQATKASSAADDKKAGADRALQEEQQRLHDKHKVTENDLMHLQDLKDKDKKATDEQTTAHQNLASAQQAVNDKGSQFNQTLDILEPKVKGNRDSISDSAKKSNELGSQWQQLSNTNGPVLLGLLDDMKGGLADMLKGINNLDNADWSGFNNAVVGAALKVQGLVGWLQAAGDKAHELANIPIAGGGTPDPSHQRPGGRAFSGMDVTGP